MFWAKKTRYVPPCIVPGVISSVKEPPVQVREIKIGQTNGVIRVRLQSSVVEDPFLT